MASEQPDPGAAAAEPRTSISDGIVWLGDLAGFSLVGGQTAAGDLGHAAGGSESAPGPVLVLSHRCGWSTARVGAFTYLGNIVDEALAHRRAGCTQSSPHVPPRRRSAL